MTDEQTEIMDDIEDDGDNFTCISCGHKGPCDEFHCTVEEPICYVCVPDFKVEYYQKQLEFFHAVGRPKWTPAVVDKAVTINQDRTRGEVDIWGYVTDDGVYKLSEVDFGWAVKKAAAGPYDYVCEFENPLQAGVLQAKMLPDTSAPRKTEG